MSSNSNSQISSWMSFYKMFSKDSKESIKEIKQMYLAQLKIRKSFQFKVLILQEEKKPNYYNTGQI